MNSPRIERSISNLNKNTKRQSRNRKLTLKVTEASRRNVIESSNSFKISIKNQNLKQPKKHFFNKDGENCSKNSQDLPLRYKIPKQFKSSIGRKKLIALPSEEGFSTVGEKPYPGLFKWADNHISIKGKDDFLLEKRNRDVSPPGTTNLKSKRVKRKLSNRDLSHHERVNNNNKSLKKQERKKNAAKENSDFNEEKDLKIKEKNIFIDLKSALKAIFSEENNGNLFLSKQELKIFNIFIEKKFDRKNLLAGFDNLNSLRKVVIRKTKKRTEEIYKFIFKNAFKFLKKKFNSNQQAENLTKEEKQYLFYNHYFKETAKFEKKSIECFFIPLTPSNRKHAKRAKLAKTINASYITLIFRSELFVEDFRDYVDNHMEEFCREVVNRKIDNLCLKWEGYYKELNYSERAIDSICQDIQDNRNNKFPWSMYEVVNAIEESRRILVKYRD